MGSRSGTDRWWHLRSEKLNGMSGEVVRTTSMCSAVRLTRYGTSTDPVLILNVNLIPEEDAPVQESVEIPDFRDSKELDRMDSLKVQVDAEQFRFFRKNFGKTFSFYGS